MKRYILFIALLSVCFLAACSYEKEPVTVENVKRVFMHEEKHYSFLYASPNNPNELQGFTLREVIRVKIITDVSPEEDIWLKYTEFGSSYDLELHLHSAEDINGAGWNHGKFGSGQTVVVE